MCQSDSEIMVSVCCITYNHEKYISQAIEGFLMQRASFKFEILIGEDCSTDSTRMLLEKYASRYPGLISLVVSDDNVGPLNNAVRVIKRARGKYIALCDGDDYWTDPYKLEKQVSFLENNKEFAICCHYMRQIEHDGQISYLDPRPVKIEYTYNDLVVNKQQQTSTASLVVQRSYINDLYTSDWFRKCYAGDKFVKLFVTSSTGKKIFVMPEVMSCYRRHQGGIWSMTQSKILKERQFNDFAVIIRQFKHNPVQKLILLRFYMKRYMKFEIKKFSINSAFHTIRTIL